MKKTFLLLAALCFILSSCIPNTLLPQVGKPGSHF